MKGTQFCQFSMIFQPLEQMLPPWRSLWTSLVGQGVRPGGMSEWCWAWFWLALCVFRWLQRSLFGDGFWHFSGVSFREGSQDQFVCDFLMCCWHSFLVCVLVFYGVVCEHKHINVDSYLLYFKHSGCQKTKTKVIFCTIVHTVSVVLSHTNFS